MRSNQVAENAGCFANRGLMNNLGLSKEESEQVESILNAYPYNISDSDLMLLRQMFSPSPLRADEYYKMTGVAKHE